MNREGRYGWIGYCLRALGRFGVREKKAMQYAFSISEATLSRDQAAFIRATSGESDVRLERGKLKLEDQEGFKVPNKAQMPELNDWLRVMLGDKFTAVQAARMRPKDHILGSVVKAIQDGDAIFILYVSRTSTAPQWRAVSPHAIVDIAGRYHARCFDHSRGRYGDFVLARITGINCDRTDMPAYVEGRGDHEWNERVKLRIFLAGHAESPAAMLDYGITSPSGRIISVRKALAPYVKDRRPDEFENLVEISDIEDR